MHLGAFLLITLRLIYFYHSLDLSLLRWVIVHDIFVICRYFSKLHFFSSKNSFRNKIRVSNSLDPDSVGPDLGPSCLQRSAADENIGC